MATDATGTPTSPDNIPTFNTAVDAPSGLGFNAAMAAIQTALSARAGSPAGVASGEVPVWDGSAWVRSSVTGMTPSGIAGYPADVSKGLAGDGTWPGSMHLLWDSVDAGVVLPATSITTPALSASFKHLHIVYQATGNVVGTPILGMQINGNSSTVYYGAKQIVNNVTQTNTVEDGVTRAVVGLLGGTTNTTFRGSGVIDIPNYADPNYAHPILSNSAAFNAPSAAGTFMMNASYMKGNAGVAISTLTFLEVTGNTLLSGSRFSVYGVG